MGKEDGGMTMIVTNSITDYSNHFIRRMVMWCCKQINLHTKLVWKAQFRNRKTRAYSGHAWWSMRICVSIGPETFFPRHNSGYRGGLPFTYETQLECLIAVTAHELTHLRQYSLHQHKGPGREAECEDVSQMVVKRFREQQSELLTMWHTEPTQKPVISLIDKRAEKVTSDLNRWQRRLKLAQTKVKKLKQRVTYYERKTAAKQEGC